MGSERIIDLVGGVTSEDVKPDTDSDVIKLPANAESRTYSLQQLTELFNVLLRRSQLRQRVTNEEVAARAVEARITQLEAWKDDFEARFEK